jgi:hypothetical protein
MAMSSSSILLHKAAFVAAGGFSEHQRYAEDIEAWFRLTCQGPVYHVAEALSEIDLSCDNRITRSATLDERVAGLQFLLDSYSTWQRQGLIPRLLQRSCRRFMQQQRGRLALYLVAAGRGGQGARLLLTGVPFGPHTWREYLRCLALAVRRR